MNRFAKKYFAANAATINIDFNIAKSKAGGDNSYLNAYQSIFSRLENIPKDADRTFIKVFSPHSLYKSG